MEKELFRLTIGQQLLVSPLGLKSLKELTFSKTRGKYSTFDTFATSEASTAP